MNKDFKASTEELINELTFLSKKYDELNEKIKASDWKKMAELVENFDVKLKQSMEARLNGQLDMIETKSSKIEELAEKFNTAANTMQKNVYLLKKQYFVQWSVAMISFCSFIVGFFTPTILSKLLG